MQLLPNKKHWRAKVLWMATSIAAIATLGYSLIVVTTFPLDKSVVLGAAVCIAILVNRYHQTGANTRMKFSAKHVFAFWGVVWLGVSGGVLLSAAASLTIYYRNRNERENTIGIACADIISTYFSALIFYMALGFLPNSLGSQVAGDMRHTNGMIAAILFMVVTHFLVNALLNYMMKRFEGQIAIRPLMIEEILYPGVEYFCSFAATLVLYFTFVQFGIEFGLVIIPLALAGEIAYKIHLRQLAQKTKQICDASRIHLATVEALATAIDARDQVGIGHVRRTQIYAIGMGELLGLSDPEINALRTGALLHDIGKLAVPDHILNKPGKLTSAEMEKTKIHASVGASILEKVGFDDPVIPTVKYHHECWNGNGYPEGLKGNNIPLTARILAVADAFDTFRGARPYRPPISREDACSFLLNGSGSQFDPRIVSLFLNNLREFERQIDEQKMSYVSDTGAQSTSVIAENGYVEQIKRANREVFTLYELARDFGSSVNLHQTLSLFTKKVAELVPFDTCTVYLMDETGKVASAEHIDGISGPAFKGRRIKAGEGPTGQVIRSGESIQNADAKLDFTVSQQEFVQDYTTMICIPLHAGSRVIGAVSVYSREVVSYEEEHLRLLETVSRIAADAIYKSLQHRLTETYALTDPMTGLPNPRSLQMQFDKEVARADRTESSFQVLMLDLDGFKAVNDTFGHKIGDKMLQEIGGIIRGQLRDYDFLSRYAGDEFIALIPDTNSHDVVDLCRRIELAINEFILPVTSETYAQVGVSLGASSYPSQGGSFDEMVVAADRGMYAIKSHRKMEQRRLLAAAETEHISIAPEMAHAENALIPTLMPDSYVVELDETHIVSSAVN